MSYTACTKGDQSKCTSNPTDCCYYMKNTKLNEAPDATQTTIRAQFASYSIPVEVGKEVYVCMGESFFDQYKDAADQSYTIVATGDTYTGYCAGAMALKAAGALASLAMMVSY